MSNNKAEELGGENREDASLMLGLSTTSSTAPVTTAGRELDARIAEKVFGWTEVYPTGRSYPNGSTWYVAHGRIAEHPHARREIAEYSTNIAAAWEVVGAMFHKGYSVIIGTNACASSQNGVKFYEGWRALGHSIFDGEDHPEPYAVAETVPLAICLAALKAVGA